jgi:chromosome segregation ATPase
MNMDNEKIQDLLLQLMQDMSYIKAKLDAIDEQKLNSRIDNLEAQNREHDRTIKSLEKRNNTMEEFVRKNMQDAKKQQTGVFISMGLALFSAVISVVVGLIF